VYYFNVSSFSAIGFNDLSPSLQQEVQDLQKRMAIELKPLSLEATLTIQKILEAEGHEERLKLLSFFVDGERKRLEARATLRGVFAGKSVVVENDDSKGMVNRKESDTVEETRALTNQTISKQGSILTDEPDSFQ